MVELINWIENNNLKNIKIKNKIVKVPKFGTLLFLEGEDGKIFSNEYSKTPKEFYFIFSDEEIEIMESNEFDYFLFKWGSRFYYSKKNKSKDEINEVIFIPNFDLFVSVGEYRDDSKDFYNLGVHSGYELLNGSGDAKNWVSKAEYYNQDALAICDKNTLAGTMAFQLACKEKGLKSIMGATYSVAYNYDENLEVQETFDMIFYAKNKKGWRNLLRINTEVNVNFDGFIPEELIFENCDGLICVIAKDSYFNNNIFKKGEFQKRVEFYLDFFGSDLYYQIDLNEYNDSVLDLKNLSVVKKYFDKYYGLVKPIYIPDSYYIEKIDSPIKSILNNVARNAQPTSKNQYLKDAHQIVTENIMMFQDDQKLDMFFDSMENTKEIVEKCNFLIDTGNHKLPKFEHKDPIGLYHEEILKGLEKKIIRKTSDPEKIEKYLNRIEEENDVIVGAGFVDYFLILWDVVKWCKTKGILVGPGRGSAGGSLVAYLLGIIEIDPIEYDLLFERFLNKTRVSGERAKSADSLPDIDIDFEGTRRNEVKRYLEEKYTVNNVCSIGTYTRMKVKGAMKDLFREKGLKFDDINKATKKIPDSIKSYWKDVFDNSFVEPYLKKFVQDNCETFELMRSIVGQPRASSIHASAVIIVPKFDSDGEPMTVFDWLPVKKMDGVLISEWEGKYIDRAGFLKEDILGIAQLSKFKSMLNLIKENKGKKIDLNKIPIDKKNVMDYFKKGWNEDVFQFTTSGLKTYSKMVKPDHVEDLISMNALFRPGPMDSGSHQKFAKIKHGKAKAKFDPFMEVVTDKTHGLYVFQEQVMQAMVVGGLSLAESDQVRTYMKKFDDESLSKFKIKFIDGYSKMFENGKGADKAIEVWDKLYAFSAYGFNRSHSAAYSLMSYWCQYLKVHFPLEFWTASLNFSDEKTEIPNRLSEIYSTNKLVKNKITVMPPDINKSDITFTCDDSKNEIYWSLTKVKNAGSVAVSNILKSREQSGFYSLEDFLNRVPKSKVNKRVVMFLIMAGAFDRVPIESKDFYMVGDKERNRFNYIKHYCEIIKSEIPENLLEQGNDKSWFWIHKQREITGFGNIDFKSMLSKKSNSPKIINSYFTSNDFLNWKDPQKGKREKWDDGHPCTVCGRILAVKKGNCKNGVMYSISMESNNVIIKMKLWPDAVDKWADKFLELEKTKELFALFGAIYYDNWSLTNSFKVISKTKIINL